MQLHRLDKYGFSKTVVETARPIEEAVNRGNLRDIINSLVTLTYDLCHKIENSEISAKQADQVYTLIDLFLDDIEILPTLGRRAEELLTEGMTLHHLGQEIGTNLFRMRVLADRLRSE